jgi:hypothetical protein
MDIDSVLFLLNSIVEDAPLKRKRSGNRLTIHVFSGGKSSIQSIPFTSAVGRSNVSDVCHITEFSCKDVKDRNMTEKDFVDWLLESDVHFILSHVHQGLKQLAWHMVTLEMQLKRLTYHPGFPNMTKLHCPVFLQNKIRYLNDISQHCNPTLQVPLNRRSIQRHLKDRIEA